MPHHIYQYIGPIEILESAQRQPAGTPILSATDIATWLESEPTERLADGTWVATFTISLNQILYFAPRRSEHVACASGGPVLSAGEIMIDDELRVTAISNQSTGFCPEPESWNSVKAVLDQIGLSHPGQFTSAVIFRKCPKCKERNIVKDSWYYCQICDTKLPKKWNFSNPEF